MASCSSAPRLSDDCATSALTLAARDAGMCSMLPQVAFFRSLVSVENTLTQPVCVRLLPTTPTDAPTSGDGDVRATDIELSTLSSSSVVDARAAVEVVLMPSQVWYIPAALAASCAFSLRPAMAAPRDTVLSRIMKKAGEHIHSHSCVAGCRACSQRSCAN